jgi:adenylate cyclase
MIDYAIYKEGFCQFAGKGRPAFDKGREFGENEDVPAKIHMEIPGRDTAVYELANTTSIGRSPGNQIILGEDNAVSRQHAMIRLQGEQEYYLIDLGSANGTLLNGKLLIGPTLLRTGDEIKIGETVMCFELIGPSPEEQQLLNKSLMEKTRVAWHMATMVILVCDIRNFTRIGELLPPDLLAKFLGSWFRKTSEIIMGLGGVVDKFIGDAVMAYWSVDAKNPQAAQENAVKAAIQIHQESRAIQVPDHEDFEFGVGVGINQGLVSSGSVGISQRDSTIMGDSVTLAFRLESACKIKKVPVIVGADLYQGLGGRFQFIPLGQVKLKGKTTSPEAYGLVVD